MSDTIKTLKALIERNTENPPGNTRHIVEWIREWAAEEGITSECDYYDTDKANIILSVGDAPRSLVLTGHLDTVPIGKRSNWTKDPIGAQELDGYVYGRGSADMKAGVAACLGAVKHFNRLSENKDLDYMVTFLGTSDEEIGLEGAKHAVKSGIMNSADFLLVAEPTGLNVGIAEKAVLWMTIQARGRAAHGSTPEKGINAIEAITDLFPMLRSALPELQDPILGQSTLNIGVIQGGKSANVVPEYAELQCDYRLVPPINPQGFAKKIADLLKSEMQSSPAKFTHLVRQIMAPLSVSPDNEFVKQFITLGKRPDRSSVIGLNYGTDAAVLVGESENPVPFVIYGPGDPQAIHIADERVAIAEVLEAERVIFEFLKKTALSSPEDE
ncbi:MAG: M20 family metallopeptidase [Candidatus Heimdallarchaeota archaeon]